ncbi:pantoate--beta-alanine ligase [Helicobacter sp. 11S03491-1]|uniref:pantoate--beta-alanine ligase n=1 Tax=Helicobacter sp. 11S03491-1 TaxID=1476196 RepID=UPI000BA79E85|nr:pantoate--beta-alanine ligase [Helicobacter sp. 11S03491-1]PAF41462.1 pantoate--beta-alanine ligase [Helicobacter sp. 11S03491-1]
MKTLLLSAPGEFQDYRRQLHKDVCIGFVPTMGALHEGHLSLIKASKQNNTHTVVSIFVNPTQFGANEDFTQYPRDIQKDFKICQEAGVDVVFAPEISQMYPNNDEISINPPKNMGYIYEGFIREGHFNGVLTIVLKLIHLICPHHIYFGQKDAQQLLLIKRLVSDTFLPTKVIPCPTQRDFDGLALSSRNIYLSPQDRKEALKIPIALQNIKKAIQEGEINTSVLIELGKKELKGLEVAYLDACDYNLVQIQKIRQNASIILIAAKVGKTRLIDNLWI